MGAYLTTKAKNLATHEDIDKLVDQVKAVTTATKEIEARISIDVWDRQKQWEMKKEAVVSAMHAMGEAENALGLYAAACELDRKTAKEGHRLIASDEWHERIDDFGMKRAMALLVCEPATNDALHAVLRIMRSGANDIENGEKTYVDLELELRPAMVRAFAMARRELGITKNMTDAK